MSIAALILAMQAARQGRQGQQADTEALQRLIDQVSTLAEKPGRDGRDGPPGRDGVGVERATVRDGRLILTRTTGDDIDVGPVTGPIGPKGGKGDPGESVIGPPGPAGRDGRDGEDGVGIANVERVKDNLVVTLDDGRTVDLGSFRGPQGPSGPRGPTGTGGGGASGAITSSGLTVSTANRLLGARTAGGAVEELQGPYLAVFATRATAGSNVFPTATNVACPWDNIKHNPYNWTINSNSDFVVPSGVSRIRVTFAAALTGSTHPSVSAVSQAYSALFYYNASNTLINVALGFSQPGFDTYTAVVSMFDVTPGWYVRGIVAHQNGSTLTYKTSLNVEQSFFSIEVLA